MFRVEEEKVNEKYATHKEEGEQNGTDEDIPTIKVNRRTTIDYSISKNRFDLSDSEEDTEPETAKNKHSP